MELSLEAQLTKSIYDIYYDEDEDGEASRTIASAAAALEQDKAVQGKEREFAFQYLWRCCGKSANILVILVRT